MEKAIRELLFAGSNDLTAHAESALQWILPTPLLQIIHILYSTATNTNIEFVQNHFIEQN